MKRKYMFMFLLKNLARKGLTMTALYNVTIIFMV